MRIPIFARAKAWRIPIFARAHHNARHDAFLSSRARYDARVMAHTDLRVRARCERTRAKNGLGMMRAMMRPIFAHGARTHPGVPGRAKIGLGMMRVMACPIFARAPRYADVREEWTGHGGRVMRPIFARDPGRG
jgi:hypothetical protein